MGQKINPTIFRLGVNKTWKTEFFEKKNNELPLYVFKDLEIRNYIERIFETYGIILHDYKQHYNGSTLNLYISYFITSDFTLNEKLIIRNPQGQKKTIRNFNGTTTKLGYSLSKEELNTLVNNVPHSEIKHYLNLSSYSELPFKVSPTQLKELSTFQNDKNFTKSPTNFQLNGLFAEICQVLNLFTNNRLNIVFNFCCVNKDFYFFKTTQEKVFTHFQKFRNTPFFEEGIELLFQVTYNSNSANLLAKFISSQLKKLKRQKFFLSFLKQTLTILVNLKLSKIKGVKIAVKGRLNGVPRATQKIMVIGDVPAQSVSAKLDYSQTTIHNSNGSYGIKVWIVEK